MIVGGGIAGLTMAKHFLEKKESVTLLEWYPKVGGRIATYRDDTIEYEMGAKRIHVSHHRILALLKRYKIQTAPMSNEKYFHNDKNVFSELIQPIMRVVQSLDVRVLQQHTIGELLPLEFHPILTMFPYYAEIHTLRADLAIPLFLEKGPMVGQEFLAVLGGLDQLITKLSDGVTILARHRVEDIVSLSGGGFELIGNYGKKKDALPFRIQCRRLVLATEYRSFGRFSLLHRFEFMKYLTDSPLIRIYARYPIHSETGKVWFHDRMATVVDSPIRFFAPIQKQLGLILISYTDGGDTEVWKNLEGDKLVGRIQKELRLLFPDLHIPDPFFLKKHSWIQGCTYWKKGNYSLEDMVKQAHNPMKDLYICGESVNPHQSWMESALESAERVQSLL